jgi:hypothetical protein
MRAASAAYKSVSPPYVDARYGARTSSPINEATAKQTAAIVSNLAFCGLPGQEHLLPILIANWRISTNFSTPFWFPELRHVVPAKGCVPAVLFVGAFGDTANFARSSGRFDLRDVRTEVLRATRQFPGQAIWRCPQRFLRIARYLASKASHRSGAIGYRIYSTVLPPHGMWGLHSGKSAPRTARDCEGCFQPDSTPLRRVFPARLDATAKGEGRPPPDCEAV